MKRTSGKTGIRGQLIQASITAYMDLFVMMQFSAVSHWLMHELTFAQARALIILAAKRELAVSELARMLAVRNPTASILVQHLVDRGLVTRTPHGGDRRRVVVRLSEQGRRIGEGRRGEREKQWQRWLGRLGDAELEGLARGLSALQGVVRSELGGIARDAGS